MTGRAHPFTRFSVLHDLEKPCRKRTFVARRCENARNAVLDVLTKGAGRRPNFADLEPTHISYQAAAAAVSAGVLDLAKGRFFLPTATVRGSEALDVVRRLERLSRV